MLSQNINSFLTTGVTALVQMLLPLYRSILFYIKILLRNKTEILACCLNKHQVSQENLERWDEA